MESSCYFCGIKYDKNQHSLFNRERRSLLAESHWAALIHGVDENNRPFIMAEGDDESDYYYPKFCPECGRNLE